MFARSTFLGIMGLHPMAEGLGGLSKPVGQAQAPPRLKRPILAASIMDIEQVDPMLGCVLVNPFLRSSSQRRSVLGFQFNGRNGVRNRSLPEDIGPDGNRPVKLEPAAG